MELTSIEVLRLSITHLSRKQKKNPSSITETDLKTIQEIDIELEEYITLISGIRDSILKIREFNH